MTGFVQWFVRNPVAANLLMLFIVVGGISSLTNINKQIMPSAALDVIRVSVVYLGASPEDVEARILIPIEEAVSGLKGIKRLISIGRQGQGVVTVYAIEGYDTQVLMNEVKARVDGINTFPGVSERPIIQQSYAEEQSMYLTISGDVSEKKLKEVSRNIRDKIATIPGAEKTKLEMDREYEISIEISEFQLQKYSLTFDDIAQAIRRSSINVGAGRIDDVTGETHLITKGQAYVQEDFASIIVLRQADGNQVLLKDVATIVDGFEDAHIITRYNGKPTLMIMVIVDRNPNVVELSKRVQTMLTDDIRPNLPAGIKVDVILDLSDSFQERLNLLLGNGISGLVLVFVGLLLFLTPALAIWVTVGILISFLGCFWLLPFFGVSLNMISLFAFVLILGIVVDDAVIIGESIHRKNQQGMFGAEASVAGAIMVSKPVVFSALTTMIAFSPLLFVLGATRQFTIAIPVVVILTLAFSLIESLCILPVHLKKREPRVYAFEKWPGILQLNEVRKKAVDGLQYFITRVYRPFLDQALKKKILSLVSFFSVCAFIVSFTIGGWIKFAFMPSVLNDFIFVQMEFPSGVPLSVKEDGVNKLETSYNLLKANLEKQYPDREIIKSILFWTGSFTPNVQAYLTLEPAQNRDIDPAEIARQWRELTEDVPDAKELTFFSDFNNSEPAIDLVLSARDPSLLAAAGADLREKLSTYPGVYAVVDSSESASSEAVLSLRPGAENLNLSLSQLARQVRQAFYGEEVQRIPRGKDSVKVMVRLPAIDRSSFDTLQSLRIRTADGDEVPFEMVANIESQPGTRQIYRIDRFRTLRIVAKVNEATGNLNEIKEDIQNNYLQQWRSAHPGVVTNWSGAQEGQDEFTRSLSRNAVLALFGIFFLLAVAFRSYVQPLIILTAIPCGCVGALIGHFALGLNISLMSILGVVAAAGVVINDNLVLLDYINRLRREGYDALAAVRHAAEQRFRPIFLTSFTTFIGLIPFMLENSVQAQFLKPTVISLAFGVLFATTVTLILVPVLYLLLDDTKSFLIKLLGGDSSDISRDQNQEGIGPS